MSRLPTFEAGEYHAGVMLDDVTPRVSMALSRMLRPDDLWKEWAGILKDPLGEYMYLMQDIWLLELEKDPVDVIWRHLGKHGRVLGFVRDTLIQAGLMRPAQFVALNVLHEEFPGEIPEVDVSNAFTNKCAITGGKNRIQALQTDMRNHYSREFQHVTLVPWNEHFIVELQRLYTQVKVIPVQKGQRGTIEPQSLASLAWRNDQDRKFVGQILEESVRSGSSGRGPRILVEGEAGTGKSTLLQKIALDWSSSESRQENTGAFPVPFDLVLLLEGHSIETSDIKEVLTSELLSCLGSDYRGILDDPEVQRKTLILVDAADEIQDAKQKLLPLLSGQQFGKCAVLLTSRTNHVADLSKYFDDTYVLPGFTTSSVHEFLKKYAEETGCSEEQLKVLLESRSPEVSALRMVPLFLVYLCVLVEDGYGDLPQTRTELYQTITQLVVDKTADRLDVSLADCNKAFENLCSIAFAVNAMNKNDFQESELPESCQMTSLTEKFGFLNKRMSKSRLAPKKVFSFSHRTLQEFLTASHAKSLKQEEREESLKDKRAESNWSMVLVFLSGLLGGDEVELERLYQHLICKDLQQSVETATSQFDGDSVHQSYHLGLQCLAESGLFSTFKDQSPKIVPHTFVASSVACYYCMRGFEIAAQIDMPHKPEVLIAEDSLDIFQSYREVFHRLLSSKWQQSLVVNALTIRGLVQILKLALPLFEKLENFYLYLFPLCLPSGTLIDEELACGLKRLCGLKSLVIQSASPMHIPDTAGEETLLTDMILRHLGNKIQILILTKLQVSDSTATLLESRLHTWQGLRKLVLENLLMEGTSLLKILKILEHRQHLTTVALCSCFQASTEEVRQALIQSLATILSNNDLESFTLGNVDLRGDLTPLVKELESCHSIEKLEFHGEMFSPEQRANVLGALGQLKSLQKLTLLTLGISEVPVPFAQSLKQLRGLEKLEILSDNIGSSEEFTDVCESVRSMQQLHTLNLDNSGLTDDNLEGLARLLENPGLRVLSLKANSIGKTAENIEKLIRGLTQCREIEQIELSIGKVSQDILKLMATSLAENAPNLRILKLQTSDIQGYISLGRTGLGLLKSCLPNLKEYSFGVLVEGHYFRSTKSAHMNWRRECSDV